MNQLPLFGPETNSSTFGLPKPKKQLELLQQSFCLACFSRERDSVCALCFSVFVDVCKRTLGAIPNQLLPVCFLAASLPFSPATCLPR